jgi:hypothetical protein
MINFEKADWKTVLQDIQQKTAPAVYNKKFAYFLLRSSEQMPSHALINEFRKDEAACQLFNEHFVNMQRVFGMHYEMKDMTEIEDNLEFHFANYVFPLSLFLNHQGRVIAYLEAPNLSLIVGQANKILRNRNNG